VPRKSPKAYRLLIRDPKFVATIAIPAAARASTRPHATPVESSPVSVRSSAVYDKPRRILSDLGGVSSRGRT